MIHPLSDVQSKNIGDNTNIWQFCVVLPNAKIGSNCNICSHCFIENDVIIGDSVTIKCGVQLWDGVRVEDNVFIGPNVSFCNDKYPKSKNKNFTLQPIIIKKGASVGANATLLPGITIGENALIAAGSVVAKDVPANVKFINGKIMAFSSKGAIPPPPQQVCPPLRQVSRRFRHKLKLNKLDSSLFLKLTHCALKKRVA